MEEDDEDYKLEILPWALSPDWRGKVTRFLRKRDRLWARIGYRAVVSNKCCQEVVALLIKQFSILYWKYMQKYGIVACVM